MELLSGSQSGGRVWIENHPLYGWAPGSVDTVEPNSYTVVDEHGEKFEIPHDKARPVDPVCLTGVDDLLSLGDFSEGALLHNIRVRYYRDDIYTGIGSPILISVNPFMNINGLYSEAKQKLYRGQGGGDRNDIPPHLFSVGAAAHSAMLGDSKDQSIIISGESGAGKTEATKRILAYFANLQRGGNAGRDSMSIEEQVLRSNPILEAFGNAKTLRNDNSSRFGKYIGIEFDKSGKLTSAKISSYLLEKIRIVTQQPGERGYHAFYQLCAGATSLPGLGPLLGLRGPDEHTYMSGGAASRIDGVDDQFNFDELVQCMRSLNFSIEERDSVFKIAAAVVHLGDLTFEEHEDSADGSKISCVTLASKISSLLHVDVKALAGVFQFKTLSDPFTKKTINRPQEPESASNTRHAMARATYSRLFDWLVWRINQSTMAKNAKTKQQYQKIGILDIYGFEVFETNSFEQLCINFANEKLQQHFNSHMFTMEQRLYTAEGISWSHIEFKDNGVIVDTLERKPLGLFCMIDAECLMPKATDMTALAKIYKQYETSSICYKPSKFASTNFAVAHYAGEVVYDIKGFLEKNTDKLHADILNLLKTSTLPLLSTMFTHPEFDPDSTPLPKKAAESRSTANKPAASGARNNITVSMMFRQQLDQLVNDLRATNPRYIRCIKPNENKASHDLNSLEVQRQLRCAGMLESIRIRRAGYSVRLPFRDFFSRFRLLCPLIAPIRKPDHDFKDLSRKLLVEMENRYAANKEPLGEKMWQIGKSKVFLKDELKERLEKSVGFAVKKFVIRIQSRWRGYRRRKKYLATRRAAVLAQSALRMVHAIAMMKEAKEKHDAAISVQTALRTAVMRRAYLKQRLASTRIQQRFRGWICRKHIGKLKGKLAAARIQKMREEEERKAKIEAAKKMEDQKNVLAQMLAQQEQKRIGQEREIAEMRAQQEQKRLEQEREMNARKQESLAAAEAISELQQLRQEVEHLRKENVRLQGVEQELYRVQRENADLHVQLARGGMSRPSIPPPHHRVGVVQRAPDLTKRPSKKRGSVRDGLAATMNWTPGFGPDNGGPFAGAL